MDNKSTSKYKNDFLTVRKFINEFDPCDLIKIVATEDEYDCMTQQIISYLYAKRSNQEIKDLIVHEIETHFGLTNPKDFKEPDRSMFFAELETFIIKVKNK